MTVWPRVYPESFTDADGVKWQDGKPRCAKHTGWCLVPARAIGLPGDGHLCSLCMREHYDRDVRESA